MTQVLISVGANKDNPEQQVHMSLDNLRRSYPDAQMSQLYLTEPVGTVIQGSFVNAAIVFKTTQTASEVLKSILAIETKAGRDRLNEIPKGPRVLDLDIILFGTEIWSDESLEIPHPRYYDRRFVLIPAAELVADMIDPVFHKTIAQILQECSDHSWINPLEQKVLAE